MIVRWFSLLALTGLCLLVARPASAQCGEGYVERFDRQGQPYCVGADKARGDDLKQKQALRTLQRKWAADAEASRRKAVARQLEIEQRRRDRARKR